MDLFRSPRVLPLALLVALLSVDAAQAQLPTDLPNFTALYRTVNPRGGGFTGQVATFTPQGPIAGTFLPGNLRQEYVAVDPRGPTYYAGYGWHSGVGPVSFDPKTGATTPLTLPTNDPELLSWPTGLAFDTTRNRLLLSNLGGEGFLYSYAPESAQWTRLASLQNVDLHALTYSAATDSLFALDRDGRLLRYTPEGQAAGTIRLDPLLPSGLDERQSQLIATGDKLVLLTQPIGDLLDPNLPAMMRSYIIDPASGKVTSLGPVRIVPEPGAAALFAGAMGAVLLRRRRV